MVTTRGGSLSPPIKGSGKKKAIAIKNKSGKVGGDSGKRKVPEDVSKGKKSKAKMVKDSSDVVSIGVGGSSSSVVVKVVIYVYCVFFLVKYICHDVN